MARSNGRGAVAALFGAVGYLLLSQLAAFVNPAQSPRRQLRSRVSLAATQADVDAAKKAFELQKWAANHLAGEGSAAAAAAATRAQQAEAAYVALKAQLDGQAPPAAAPAMPVAAAPAPVAAAPAPAGMAVSKEDLAAAKSNAQLLTWAASKLASEGHPQAAAMKARADQAVAAFEALKQAQASGAAAPAAPAPVPAAAVPAPAVTPAAPAPVMSGSAPSAEEVLKAKKEMELHEWAAKSLVSKNSPAAAAMQAKAAASRQTYEALVAMKEKAMA